jgi:hypothetical protein
VCFQCLTIVVGMTQRCYIGIWKSAERLDRPKGVRNLRSYYVASRDLHKFFSSRLLGGSLYEVELEVLRLALVRSSNSVPLRETLSSCLLERISGQIRARTNS